MNPENLSFKRFPQFDKSLAVWEPNYGDCDMVNTCEDMANCATAPLTTTEVIEAILPFVPSSTALPIQPKTLKALFE
ncbi:hypothetical protein SNOG_04540 [Parastagonospora nodorum SN15]|uniref:Uncharacterized protein n=1 Tax=Phaeosphaeria nodorum (strain SN15 / ATCC MYA-4574 / FGSC 10173) TaxID=321614 RepID=Q0UUM4_PHANO|nr:hypothetical protein SNOG_04540 [Parastagonospora nodorum SN15]EAT88300.1 hypothetical protein SNOG_04540 [Parastagonospora nodorum SN15]